MEASASVLCDETDHVRIATDRLARRARRMEQGAMLLTARGTRPMPPSHARCHTVQPWPTVVQHRANGEASVACELPARSRMMWRRAIMMRHHVSAASREVITTPRQLVHADARDDPHCIAGRPHRHADLANESGGRSVRHGIGSS